MGITIREQREDGLTYFAAYNSVGDRLLCSAKRETLEQYLRDDWARGAAYCFQSPENAPTLDVQHC